LVLPTSIARSIENEYRHAVVRGSTK